MAHDSEPGHVPTDTEVLHQLADWTDSYFGRTRAVVEHFGDRLAKQVIFMRRPVVFAPKMCFSFVESVARARGGEIVITPLVEESKWVGAGTPMFTLEGDLSLLLECETRLLQRIGPSCVAAYNAYTMCAELPETQFLAMEARHCAGVEMHDMMSYAAAVGSRRARDKVGARGCIVGSCHGTSGYFEQKVGLGTMPHSLIGYAGSTLRAAEMFREVYPDRPLTVLVDFFGREVTDALEVCRAMPDLVRDGLLSVRIDTHGGRFSEGLDTNRSYQILEHHAPFAIRGYRSESELRHMIGTGVSAASLWHLRESLNDAGFERVPIVGSSGFTPEKCRVMAIAKAPIDVIGTGSFVPENWNETFATCDLVALDGVRTVKLGREFLLEALEHGQSDEGNDE